MHDGARRRPENQATKPAQPTGAKRHQVGRLVDPSGQCALRAVGEASSVLGLPVQLLGPPAGRLPLLLPGLQGCGRGIRRTGDLVETGHRLNSVAELACSSLLVWVRTCCATTTVSCAMSGSPVWACSS